MSHRTSSRRRVRASLVIAALALIAASCGDADDDSDAAETSASAAAAETTVAPEASEAPETTVAPETSEAPETTESGEAGDAAADCDAGQRSFDHPFLVSGAICVPENPERVVDLGTDALEVLVATGDAPVGTQTWATGIMGRNFPYLADALVEVADVGFNPINLEAVALAEPDLIIADTFIVDGIEDELRAIAPTAVFDTSGSGDWKEGLDFAGALLNREDVVAERFAEYEARLEVLRATIGDPGAIEVSIARVWDDSSQYMINLVNSYPSVVVADAGLARPASQALTADEALAEYDSVIGGFVSTERLDLMDGDIAFVWSQAPDEEGDLAADQVFDGLPENPLWDTLEVVQNDQVVRAGGHWVGWGFHAAHAIIDDLFVHVAGVDPAEVSPNPLLDAGA